MSQFKELFDELYADAMIAHRWFEARYGEQMRGRNFAVKCSMADALEADKTRHPEQT